MSDEEKLEQVRLLNARNIYNAYKDLGLNPSESSIAKDLLAVLEQEENEIKKQKNQQENDFFWHQLKKHSIKKSIGAPDVFYRVSSGNLTKEALAKRLGIFILLGGMHSPIAQQLVSSSKKTLWVRDFIQQYKKTIFDPHTKKNAVSVMDYNYQTNDYYAKEKVGYDYDLEAIVDETVKNYPNPLLSFYLIYTHLNDVESYLETFLKIFNCRTGTDYVSFENFLYKNHFTNEMDFKNSALEIIEKEIECYGNR